MIDHRTAHAALLVERSEATDLLSSLTRDFAGIVTASADSNADDEHDPEGSTIAFERSQVSTMIEQTRRRLSEVDAALDRLAGGTYGTCERCGRPIPGRTARGPSRRADVRRVRLTQDSMDSTPRRSCLMRYMSTSASRTS